MSMRYNTLILQYFHFNAGGVQSYYARLMKYARNLGMRVIFLLDGEATIEKGWDEILSKYEVEVYYVRGVYPFYSIKNKEGKRLKLYPNEEIIAIAAMYKYWIMGTFLQKKFEVKSLNNFFYIVHPYGIRLIGRSGKPHRTEGNSALNKFFFKKILAPMVTNNAIVFMDDETKNFAKEYYQSYDFDLSKLEIIHLGMEEGDNIEENAVKEKYYSEHRQILTAGRFDFPFKGYILGTIDAFAKLQKDYPNTELLIIGSESLEGERMVAEKISHYGPEVANRIKVLKSLPYEHFLQYMKNAYAFVGIGTTLLDAAKMGVPGVVGIANMYDDISYGLWEDTPDILGGSYEENLATKSTITDDLSRILEMSYEDYLQLCMKHRSLMVQSYGLQHIGEQIMNHKTTNEQPYSKFALMAYSFLYFVPLELKRAIKWLLPNKAVNWIKDFRQKRRMKKERTGTRSFFAA